MAVPLEDIFSSNSSTLPWAQKTGRMTLRPFSVVDSIIYDDKKEKATGVRVIDTNTKEEIAYYANVIFVNASTLNTNLILLNSRSRRFPNGLGNDSGTLGKYIAFHNFGANITAEFDGLKQFTTDGRNPSGGAYIPRFRNVFKQETDFLRGYSAELAASRSFITDTRGVGDELKNHLLTPELGPWKIGAYFMGETIPKETNTVGLDSDKKDAWGVPLLKINVAYDDNDSKMKIDFLEQFTEMFTEAGLKNIQANSFIQAPGLDIHEMGGARMGHDSKTSVLNKWNQVHACKNVFVTDGASMTSTSTQNPSLTYMALTARAVDYAVSELKKGNI